MKRTTIYNRLYSAETVQLGDHAVKGLYNCGTYSAQTTKYKEFFLYDTRTFQ